MSVGLHMAKKKAIEANEPQYGTMTRMADDVVETARVLAPMVGQSMAQLMSDILRPILAKRLEDEMRRRLSGK